MTDFGLFPGILGHVPGWRALDRSVRQVCRLTGYTQDLTITLALTILIAAWAIVSGGVLFWAARDFDREHGRWWLALSEGWRRSYSACC
ncbi:DUF308 domain-containing protein [Billgrantia desiderata]|uniref:DUF308 domain-containing protein n=1 Tax=Billgrantia desiderata TaxID=52021 RepID=UPI0034612EF3